MKFIYVSIRKSLLIIVLSILFLICIIFISTINQNTKLESISVNSSLEEKIFESNSLDKKIAYLTFDDGPTQKETEKILDVLKEENIKATFFVVGKHVKEYPELVRREYEEGHYIANHGYSHNNNKLYESMKNFALEIKNTDLEIGKAIGDEEYCAHIFRFPNGYMSNLYKQQKKEAAKVLKELDYDYIDWNCLNKDSEIKTSNTELIRNLKKTSNNKTPLIILMHDTGDVNNTSAILKESIEYLKQEGYEFRNMYDFIEDEDIVIEKVSN